MAKFKVGDKVEDFAKGKGIIIDHIEQNKQYPFRVEFEDGTRYIYTEEGSMFKGERESLRLTGRPFNVGDKVVIGGEKGKVVSKINSTILNAPPLLVKVDMGIDYARITTDGRAWPGTPIIAEHDWDEESETANKELDEAVKNSQAFSEYQNQKKESFDISPGFAKDWPVYNGIEDVTVSPEEVRHIAKMQDIDEFEYRKMMEVDALKDQHNYTRMALSLTGFNLDYEAAALITETVKKVLELGGEFSLQTAREVEARVNEMYKN